jgi:DNA-binding CsgD family transcriptional regulator
MTSTHPYDDQALRDLSRRLTPRQREIAELIAQGLTNEQIAQRLVIAPGTAANHVAQILARLGLQSRVQVATELVREGGARDADQVLALLDRLRQVETTDMAGALQHAANVLLDVFDADKVDCFVFDQDAEMLVAIGTSDTPLGRRQRELELDRLPLAHGGRVAWAFRERQPFIHGHLEEDEIELLGVRRDLGIRSELAAPFGLNGEGRGVLVVTSTQPDWFTPAQLQLLQFVAYWVGLVAPP